MLIDLNAVYLIRLIMINTKYNPIKYQMRSNNYQAKGMLNFYFNQLVTIHKQVLYEFK